jgi:hypothetical protein
MNCTIAYYSFRMLHTDGATATHTSEVCIAITLKMLYMGFVTFSFTQHDITNDFNECWSIHIKVISRS